MTRMEKTVQIAPKRIFVSNRLPYSVNLQTQQITRGSGGLVSALLGINLQEPFYWMGFETDPKAVQILKERSSEMNSHLKCCPVLLDKKIYDSYYDGVSNDLLWPVFHYENHLASFHRENWHDYLKANEVMAEEILKIAGDYDSVWIHDFHFLALPKMLKERNPTLKIGFFLHIPFPSNEIFRQLPVREEILKSLICCDLIGFQEYSYLNHFVTSLKSFLGVDATLFHAEIGDHTLHMGVFPICIDTEKIMEKAATAHVKELTSSLENLKNSQFRLLGIDRLDYTKGLELKLQGFQQALRKYPGLVGKISLLQVAVPTRQKVPCYAQAKRDLDELVGAINGEFGRPDYVPVQYIFNSIPEDTMLSLYRSSHGVLVTSKRDGMNLVAMEYAMAQDLENPGVLILSEFAGAASLLGDSLFINPWDADAIADAIHKTVVMPLAERKARMSNMQKTLLKYSSTKWAEGFLKDLETMTLPQHASPSTGLELPVSRWPADILSRLLSKKIKLVLDYDGTIVPLQPRPEMALLPQTMRDILRSLQQHVEVIILSGRKRSFLESEFAGLPFTLVAEHGAFYKLRGKKWKSRVSSDIQSWYPEVEQVMEAYADKVPFSFVEKKKASLVWHFRQSPAEFADFLAKKLDEELKTSLGNEPVQVNMGSKIVEAKATECNKGTFLRRFMRIQSDSSLYICLGDDRTDEDMFKVLRPGDIGIKVGPGPTAASYRLSRQKEVIHFLLELRSIFVAKHQPSYEDAHV